MKTSIRLMTIVLISITLHADADEMKARLYAERYRPQYHFTADEGWINDPNGLVYVNGVYHLFFQHDRKHWGHAIYTSWGEGQCLAHSNDDGSTFTPKAKIRKLDFGKNLSASQSWKNLPDGRVIQICWLRLNGSDSKYPGMPFQQQLSFPTELTLRRIDDEVLLCRNPISEI